MRTLNKEFINHDDLKNFIVLNKIDQEENILLQIFTGICNKEFINDLIKSIKTHLPKINIIGSTTDGEILENDIRSYSTILSFSIFDETKIKVFSTSKESSSFQTAKKLIDKIENKDDAKAAIIFTDGLDTNGEIFLEAFNKEIPDIIVAGGLAGDNANFSQTYIFTSEHTYDNGAIAAVLYNPKLQVHTSFSFGWETIGKEFTVNNAIENRVYEIDNQSPTELYKKYLGQTIQKKLPATGIEFPIILFRDGRKIARAVTSRHEDGSLSFAGNIKNGDKVYLGYGNIETILNNIPLTFQSMTQNAVESIFIYSCMARKRLLGTEIQREIAPLSKIAPVSGFFTYGEFYNCKHTNTCKNQLLNQTMTILALSERDDAFHYDTKMKIVGSKEGAQTIEALSHLISQTTMELSELNKELEKRVEEEVEKNRQKDKQILEQSKLAQMGQMISMIAHQWRQPLNAISAASGAIYLKAQMGTLDSEVALKKATDINSYTQHLSSTINDFRDFFKPNKQKEKITYEKVLGDVLNIVEVSIFNKNIQIIKELDDTTVFITYANEIKQVLLNLIKNAEDILVDKKIKDPYIKIKTENGKLYVSDNGGGIEEAIIDKIFDPYFSTKKEKNGTGLGLYMSKVIIQEHCKGELKVSNDKDGAVFSLSLPL